MCTEILRESVRYILCLTTPIDIVLLAVTFTPKKLGIVKFIIYCRQACGIFCGNSTACFSELHVGKILFHLTPAFNLTCLQISLFRSTNIHLECELFSFKGK